MLINYLALLQAPNPIPGPATTQILTVETGIILFCVIVIAYSLGILVSHWVRRFSRWQALREEEREQERKNKRNER